MPPLGCPGSNEAGSSRAARHTDDLAFQGREILLKVVEPRLQTASVSLPTHRLSRHKDVYTYEVRPVCTCMQMYMLIPD